MIAAVVDVVIAVVVAINVAHIGAFVVAVVVAVAVDSLKIASVRLSTCGLKSVIVAGVILIFSFLGAA